MRGGGVLKYPLRLSVWGCMGLYGAVNDFRVNIGSWAGMAGM